MVGSFISISKFCHDRIDTWKLNAISSGAIGDLLCMKSLCDIQNQIIHECHMTVRWGDEKCGHIRFKESLHIKILMNRCYQINHSYPVP